MSADADTPPVSPEEYNDLSHDEQRDLLDAGFEAQNASEWAGVDDEQQVETLAAIEQTAEETWTADVWGGHDEKRTIPFEVRELMKPELDAMEERYRTMAQAEEAETEEELTEILGEDYEDSLDEFADWLNEFLANVTTGDVFDKRFWETGETHVGSKNVTLPANTDVQLFLEIFLHYNEENERAQQFRFE